jgi:hypothetical protein
MLDESMGGLRVTISESVLPRYGDPYIQGVEIQQDSFKPNKLKSITKEFGNADVKSG